MSLAKAENLNHAMMNFATKAQPSLLDWNHLKALSQVQQGLVETLRMVRFKLQTSSFPSFVMLTASQLK